METGGGENGRGELVKAAGWLQPRNGASQKPLRRLRMERRLAVRRRSEGVTHSDFSPFPRGKLSFFICLGISGRLRIANPRYSQLPVGATRASGDPPVTGSNEICSRCRTRQRFGRTIHRPAPSIRHGAGTAWPRKHFNFQCSQAKRVAMATGPAARPTPAPIPLRHFTAGSLAAGTWAATQNPRSGPWPANRPGKAS